MLIYSLFHNFYKKNIKTFKDLSHQKYYRELEEFRDNINEYCLKVESYKNNIEKFYNDKHITEKFPIMCKIATSFLSVPFSSTHLERLFSNSNNNKNPRRN